MKTILIAGNFLGGVYKSSTLAAVADSLTTLGYTTRTITFDPMLRREPQTEHPPIHYTTEPEAVVAAIHDATQAPADIAIIDCHYRVIESILPLVQNAKKAGHRVIVGVIVNAKQYYSIETGITFANAFSEFQSIVFENNQDSPDVLTTPIGRQLFRMAEGRVITVPPYSNLMRSLFDSQPSNPNKGGDMGTLNTLQSSQLKAYRKSVLNSASTYAEWLIGKTSRSEETPQSKKAK